MQLPRTQLKKARGAMLAMSIFILVVIALLISSMTDLFQTGSQGVIYEVQGIRASLGANAGVERQLYRSVRLNQSCAVLNNQVINLSGVASLANCQITLGCTDLDVPADTESSAATYINLDAVANCQGGSFAVQRAIEAQYRK